MWSFLMWLDFVHYFGPFFFEERCAKAGWNPCSVTGDHFFKMLKEKIIPSLLECYLLRTNKFHARPSYIKSIVMEFLTTTFGVERLMSSDCKNAWPPQSPNLTSIYFWLWDYVKSLMYRSSPSFVAELMDFIRHQISCIHL